MLNFLRIIIIFLTLCLQSFWLNYLYAQVSTNIKLQFDPKHGFYKQAINVTITAETENAIIHYTLNGSEPALTASQTTFLYESPIVINKTSCIRAIAMLPNGSKSISITQTYIFIDDVIQQTYQSTISAGFPNQWGYFSPDYGLDADIVNDALYGPQMKNSLLSIPTMSIVMNIDDLFGSNGIYTNSEQRGEAWERPGSAELFFPDGREGFQINCAIRIHGGWFRQHQATKKHSFRLLFKGAYGPTKLRYPLFGDDAADQFDTIVLRAGANDAYSWNEARYTEQYTRDQFGRQLHELVGNVSPHGMFVHLYINGIYWGLYNPVERPDNSFSAIYHGGDKDLWDAINSGDVIDGNDNAWKQLLSKCRQGLTSIDSYLKIQGKNPDGTRNPNFPVLIDIKNYIDYMIVNIWGGNWDWPHKNYWITRDRSEASIGFQFYIWDYENTMGNNRNRSPLYKDKVNQLNTSGIGVGEPHIYLMKNTEYLIFFVDRIHQLFFNDGVFTPACLIDLYTKLASEVELAIIAESARWGDQHYSHPLTQENWYNERDWILTEYLTRRSDIVLNQFKQAGLYPNIDAPVFHVNQVYQHGGIIQSTDQISLTATDGDIYYTIDNSDPRLTMTSTAIKYLAPFTLSKTTRIKSRTYKDDNWSAMTEATFVIPAGLSELKISELHYHPLPQDNIDDREFEFIELQNTGSSQLDLSLVRFINGIDYEFPVNMVIQSGEYIVIASNSEKFQIRYGFSPFDSYDGQLDNGGERIVLVDAVEDTLISFRYNDKSPWPESADGDGYSLVFDPVTEIPDYNNATNWRVSNTIHGDPMGIKVSVEDKNDATVPKVFELFQNYPNPFNLVTRISYTIPERSRVTIKLFDLLGRKVKFIQDEEKQAGYHTILFEANERASGIYIYKIQAGRFVSYKKMLLIK